MQTVRIAVISLALGGAASCASPGGPPSLVKDVRAPSVAQRVEPEYPAELRQQRVQGVVVVGGTVAKEGGTLRNPHVVRSDDPRLSQLALDAVSRWIWRPGIQDGVPVDVEFTTDVHFSVDR